MDELELLNEIVKVHPMRYDMLITDVEDCSIIVGDATDTEIILNALRYAYLLEEKNRTAKSPLMNGA